ncbi:GNAT family N-acetyltransferase [Ketogulonicigenium vulgare]|uniref:GNAT family N-acetyltransferase n=1 Tax=Ketogulonicigenium vulgare TaxID=92945 RepID=UPI002358679E|nr:GNAT family N-acetyltransferase [Ketogulonicigenium vulgare]
MQISPLRDVPHFVPRIAQRAWQAWWQETDVTLQDYQAGVAAIAASAGIPCGFVAHDGGRYLASVFLIENDLSARPTLTPWIAALWVEEDARRQGIAAQLMQHAQDSAAALGYAQVYLCASRDNAPYYAARGFDLVERDVGGLDVFSRST